MRLPIALALVAALSTPAHAETACPQFFVDGREPALVATPDVKPVELCNEAFATLWSPETRDPIYSAEHLTPAGLTDADKTARLDAFHADDRLPIKARAALSDYKGSDAYDRGHMAPAHDMPTASAMHESFELSNMIPQDKANNRGVWARIEEFARRLVILGTEGYVVSGPVFDAEPQRLKGRVAIPSKLFKAVYIPPNQFSPKGQVGAYVVDNTADAPAQIISLDKLKAIAGIDPFPSLPAEMHAAATLPPVAGK
jgi:endonuclease G